MVKKSRSVFALKKTAFFTLKFAIFCVYFIDGIQDSIWNKKDGIFSSQFCYIFCALLIGGIQDSIWKEEDSIFSSWFAILVYSLMVFKFFDRKSRA